MESFSFFACEFRFTSSHVNLKVRSVFIMHNIMIQTAQKELAAKFHSLQGTLPHSQPSAAVLPVCCLGWITQLSAYTTSSSDEQDVRNSRTPVRVPGTEVKYFCSVPCCACLTGHDQASPQAPNRGPSAVTLVGSSGTRGNSAFFRLHGECRTAVKSSLAHLRKLTYSPLSVHTFTAWATWRQTTHYRSGIRFYK